MTQKPTEAHRRHLAAFLATGAFILLGSNVSSSEHYSAYLLPEETGFLSGEPSASVDVAAQEHMIVCRDSQTNTVVKTIPVAEFETHELAADTVMNAVAEDARRHAALLTELKAQIEEEQAAAHAAAPIQAPTIETSLLDRTMRELVRWFEI